MSVSDDEDYLRASKSMYVSTLNTFAGGFFFVISFISSYWVQTHEETFSPLKHVGLWEFCVENFQHPFDQLHTVFNGCHNIFSYEFHLIGEHVLPFWMLTVQRFNCLAIILSFIALILSAMTIIRFPLKFILSNEWWLTNTCFVCNALAAFSLFLSLSIYGAHQTWRQEGVLYLSFDHLSWSCTFAVISFIFHSFAAITLYFDTRRSSNFRKEMRIFVQQLYRYPVPSDRSGYI